ncbi:ABC transporter substrate-binding protein [Brevundimonas variabilis]|nr:ABC transporter substrate-binding protein [Brevundimonas variabilis]
MAEPLRVLSLDQCADQYVLALVPEATLALSPRADDADSRMRIAARDHRQVRPTLEAAIGFRPDVVVRYWGGDQRLLDHLERRGQRVVTLSDASDFDAIRANIRVVARALAVSGRGEALISRMDQRLLAARSVSGSRGAALYLTAGGFTAGAGTLMDGMLQAAGFENATERPGFGPVSVERIALTPPARFVLGFFDQVRADWRGPGRHPVVRRAASGRTVTRLPASVLTCPAWFAADGVAMIAARRP